MATKIEIDRCKSCGADVIWIQSETKRYICNPRILTLITDSGDVVRGRESHFSTCPDADKWRKNKRNYAERGGRNERR